MKRIFLLLPLFCALLPVPEAIAEEQGPESWCEVKGKNISELIFGEKYTFMM